MLRLVSKHFFNILLIMTMILLLLSCGVSTNSSLINYFTNEMSIYEVEYQKIIFTIDTIKTKNIQYKVHNWPKFKKHLRVDEYHVQDSTFVDDFVFPESFHHFFLKRQIAYLFVKLNKEVKFLYLHKENYDLNDVYLIYFFNGFDEGKKEYKEQGFEIYSGSQIPGNYSNWLYKINDNWAILSPKKED
jgi:hypothetical protein